MNVWAGRIRRRVTKPSGSLGFGRLLRGEREHLSLHAPYRIV